MSIERRSEKVHKARVSGDIESASVMGQHGAEKVNAKKRMQAATEARDRRIDAAQAEREEWDRIMSANEHLIPPPSPFGD